MRVSRTDQSRLAQWWFTVDHALVAAILMLVGIGLVLSLAASPAVALKKGLPAFYFVERHVVFSLAAVVVMLLVSLLDTTGVRRLALALFVISFAGLVAVQLTGHEINGARRWLSIAGHSLQPSEFAKPSFAVLTAWLFAEAQGRRDMPALSLAIAIGLAFAALLVVQPDVGQTLLVGLVWGAQFFLSGQPVIAAAALAALGAAGLGAAYFVFPHVASRVDRFLVPNVGDNSQVERAIRSFTEGGFFGRGPGEGTIKTSLPDAHTDFIFAVVAEEYGVIACLALLAVFAFITVRAFARGAREPELATRLAVQGLALLFGLQALINMAVNVGLLPAKGMTLPFISAGGSSMFAISISLGMLLALSRRRPHQRRLETPPLVARVPLDDSMGRTR
ncbi:MAG: cell division protein FtsW [Hyphomicrobiaceae bacterium]|nr:cell division protein FtsW [Hyphomicrobiaceae bacterium]